MFDKKGSFVNIVKFIFSMGVDRIFALYPKNQKRLNILKHIKEYIYLTGTYEHFYVDDLSKMILEEKKYSNWKNPCHYGKDIISINEQGFITGCSFDSSDEALLMLTKPKDILKITKIKIKKRFACPYIQKYLNSLVIYNIMAKKQTAWTKHLMSVYEEMKRKDSSIKLSDAMKSAKKTYKKA